MNSKMKFPPKILKQLEENGYFNLTKEQRIEANKKCLERLSILPNPNPDEGRKMLRVQRGEL